MRIIAGRLRGRRLVAPPGQSTRPTTDRVREALFSILGNLEGDQVADCYSGSGAMGLEAISRGARHVVLIESGVTACKTIGRNIDALSVGASVHLVQSEMERAKRTLAEHAPFDLVLSDPPWPIAQRAAEVVAKAFTGLLSPGATLVLGHPARAPLVLGEKLGITAYDTRRWGDSALTFCKTTVPEPQ